MQFVIIDYMKTLSISIAAYNQEKYLDRCIQSLIIPSIDDLEIFVVNDGSLDKTSEIAHRWADKYPKSIFVIDKENGHYGSCCNASLKQATAKYLRLLDADDFFNTEELEKYVNSLKKVESDMVITTHTICNIPPIVVAPDKTIVGKTMKLKDVDFTKYNLPDCYGMHGTTYKTSVLKASKTRLTEGCCATDTEFAYFPLRHCDTISFFDYELYMYQTDIEGQDTSIVNPKQKDQKYIVARRMLGDYCENISEYENIRNAQRIQIGRIVVGYYGMYICHFPNIAEDDKRIGEMDKMLLAADPELYRSFDQVYNCRWHFIKQYRKSGKTQKNIMSVLNFIKRIL